MQEPLNPCLCGHGLRLRLWRPDDTDLLYEAARESVAEVFPWLPWCHPAYSIEDSRSWLDKRPEQIADRSDLSFAIFSDQDAAESRVLGGCGVNGFDSVNSCCNLGYWVRSSETGKGVATRATRLLARYALTELGMARVEILAHPDNTGSQEVARKAGARQEGLLRRRLRLHNKNEDAVVFSLIPSDL